MIELVVIGLRQVAQRMQTAQKLDPVVWLDVMNSVINQLQQRMKASPCMTVNHFVVNLTCEEHYKMFNI